MELTSEKNLINHNCFDIIRLFIAFIIFYGHFLFVFSIENNILIEVAYFVRGVPIFFFLSGLFIARSIERYSAREFLVRRAIRIYPELWVCVVFNLLIILLKYKPVNGFSFKDILIYFATQFTAFQFYTGDWLRGYGLGAPNGALWTISVDIQFYLFAIVFSKLLKKKSVKLWATLIILSMIFDFALEKTKIYYPEIIYKLLECNFLTFGWIFFLGMFIYHFQEKIIPIIVKIRWIVIVIYIAYQYFVPKSILQFFEGIRYNIITTILLLLMVAGIGFSFNKRLKRDFSYSFYLYHMVVLNFILNNFIHAKTTFIQTLVYFITAIIVISIFAFLSNTFIAGKLTKIIERKILR